jgi:uncharacterized protein (UPF0332 family)
MLSLSRYAGTVNRTYYVMFEAASAMLAGADVEVDTDHGVKIKFGEMFVKTGRVDRGSAVISRGLWTFERTLTTRLIQELRCLEKLPKSSSERRPSFSRWPRVF